MLSALLSAAQSVQRLTCCIYRSNDIGCLRLYSFIVLFAALLVFVVFLRLRPARQETALYVVCIACMLIPESFLLRLFPSLLFGFATYFPSRTNCSIYIRPSKLRDIHRCLTNDFRPDPFSTRRFGEIDQSRMRVASIRLRQAWIHSPYRAALQSRILTKRYFGETATIRHAGKRPGSRPAAGARACGRTGEANSGGEARTDKERLGANRPKDQAAREGSM